MRVSINNGLTFVSPEEAVRNGSWELLVGSMDDEAREEAHSDVAPCDKVTFLRAYLEYAPCDLIVG